MVQLLPKFTETGLPGRLTSESLHFTPAMQLLQRKILQHSQAGVKVVSQISRKPGYVWRSPLLMVSNMRFLLTGQAHTPLLTHVHSYILALTHTQNHSPIFSESHIDIHLFSHTFFLTPLHTHSHTLISSNALTHIHSHTLIYSYVFTLTCTLIRKRIW